MSPREAYDTYRRAAALEREAERTDDPDAWVVTSDAWLEAGETSRAWYARLLSGYGRHLPSGELGPGLPLNLISRERAFRIERALEASRADHIVTNEERGELELFRFVVRQPERVFAYYNSNIGPLVGGYVSTFMGDHLGTIVHRGQVAQPFGNPYARIQHVRVRAINGYMYRGTCAIDNGTYCKLRRADPWLR